MRLFQKLFERIGTLEGEYHLDLKPDAKPIHHLATNVPETLRKLLKQTLDRIADLGVIASVGTPTDWGHNLVYIVKLGKLLRICLDPRELKQVDLHPKVPHP